MRGNKGAQSVDIPSLNNEGSMARNRSTIEAKLEDHFLEAFTNVTG